MPSFGGGVNDAPVGDPNVIRYATTLTIEELTGTSEGGPRTMQLRGPSMPFMGADWSVGNTLITTFYPGNPEGSQQNLGPKEMPSAWEGEWNRTLIGKSPVRFTDEIGEERLLVDPYRIYEALEDMVRKGAALRVTWATYGTEAVGDGTTLAERDIRLIDFKIVREGQVDSFKITPDRIQDIKWSIGFNWYGRGAPQKRIAGARDDNDVANAANGLEASIAAMQVLIDDITGSTGNIRLKSSHLTLGQLENLANAPLKFATSVTRKLQSLVNDFKRLGNIAKKLRALPFQIASTAVDFAANTVAISNQFVQEMGRDPPEKRSLSNKVSDITRSVAHFSRLEEAAQLNARQAQALIDKIRKSVRSTQGEPALTVRESGATRAGEILAVYRTKDGDTPQIIAMRFYKTPDSALAILQANRLPWHTTSFDRGTVLVIPRSTAARM